jgi:UDP-glucose 4-epimerase
MPPGVPADYSLKKPERGYADQEPAMTNVLVTGGLGVNGAWVTRKLVERGHRTVVFDNSNDTELLGPATAKEITLINGDITDLDALVETCTTYQIERIVHMAVVIAGIQTDLMRGFDINAGATVRVLEAAVRTGVSRVVYTSSRAVYGDIVGRFAHPTYEPITEEHPLRPIRVYDVCKAAGEGMGRNYAGTQKIEFISLRFAHIFGPGKVSRHEGFSLMTKMIEQAARGMEVNIPRGGEQRDDVIYVDDVAEGIVLALFKDRPNFDVYNISRGVGTTLNDFADAIRASIPAARITIGPGLDYHNMGANYTGVMDNSRAHKDLGFKPKFDLASGVAHYLKTVGV